VDRAEVHPHRLNLAIANHEGEMLRGDRYSADFGVVRRDACLTRTGSGLRACAGFRTIASSPFLQFQSTLVENNRHPILNGFDQPLA